MIKYKLNDRHYINLMFLLLLIDDNANFIWYIIDLLLFQSFNLCIMSFQNNLTKKIILMLASCASILLKSSFGKNLYIFVHFTSF